MPLCGVFVFVISNEDNIDAEKPDGVGESFHKILPCINDVTTAGETDTSIFLSQKCY